MSINSAMRAGVSGLVANSSALAAISDNIANVNTVAYKRSQVNFANMVTSQAVAGQYSAGGVQGVARQYVSQQGTLQSASSPTDLAISGEGFFVVTDKGRGLTDADARMFTRAGSFSVDADGYLKNDAGLYLQGWPFVNGQVSTNPSDLTTLQPINVKDISATVLPTTEVLVNANLQRPSTWSASAGAYATPNMSDYLTPGGAAGVAPDFTIPMSVTDSMGGSHSVNVAVRRSATANQWSYEVQSPDVAGSGMVASGTLAFDTSGQPIFAAPTTVTGGTLVNSPTQQGLSIPVTWTDAGIAPQTIVLDFSKLSQLADASTVNSVNPDGAGVGSVIGVQVDETGVVSALFDNSDVRMVAQVALATFPNPDGLQAVSGNAFRPTLKSGEFALKQPSSGGAGLISPSTLEASTVDLSAEFTGLITTQRAYSASSKIITTADQMLEELINIKR
ncbi:MAG: flagellar hook protein FlgE [Phenylobacterium sp.]|uniref:flagellar hook protein FlgE n=1 Tax=Phenylobacterium sp. TaxID=1871053 RepID=UPI0027375DC2|nr:flagellar hook protein FlgE [Phenylobacterium sp.]MDP3176166.1 flagellar hook protein FlgE [Phenylobacterium sp.]